jgi:hypothetical protein
LCQFPQPELLSGVLNLVGIGDLLELAEILHQVAKEGFVPR